VGSIELAVPKLRAGSYFPEWLLQPRRRAGQALLVYARHHPTDELASRRSPG